MSEIPVHLRPRRLSDWINPTGAKKVHSLIDKVYKRKNLEMAWEKVKANRGSGGIDGQNLETFEAQLDQQLDRLYRELKEGTYQPLPVRQHPIPKRDKPGEHRMLGIPAIYDRVCQQALLNRLEPVFEPLFDDASFGYRRGRSAKDALRKVWKEIEGGSEWIVDADLRDFFGSVDHGKLLSLLTQQVADGRVLRLIKAVLKAGSYGRGQFFPSERGTPQGGVASPLLSNILLTPFDREMRLKGYQLTRFADDWVITCKSAAEARAALDAARRILKQLDVELHPQKTRIVHVRLCVQQRLACTAGDKPAGARVRSLVAWIAERRETEFLKPIDDRLLGRRASHRAVMKMNVDVASKVKKSEGRARNREGEGSMDSRILTDTAVSLRRGGSDSTMTRTC
jgi:group II intron reverse transcriptase/maturase